MKRYHPMGSAHRMIFCFYSGVLLYSETQKYGPMKERLNTSLHILSLTLVIALLIWYFVAAEITFPFILTVLIAALIVIEIISLSIISKIYPESHTSFKIGIVAGLFILLGIKTMIPAFFVPLTIALFTTNFLYNFYTNTKRRKGGFKRKKNKRLKF